MTRLRQASAWQASDQQKQTSSSEFALEDRHDFLNRVPTAGSRWNTKKLLYLAEVTDRFHLPAIQTQDESTLDRNDLEQPVAVGGQTERKRRESRCLRFGV